jgi:hypothetical protein
VFACFSAAALVTKRRSYLYLGSMCSSAIMLLMVMRLGSRLFGRSALSFQAELYLGLCVFVCYVLVDTQVRCGAAGLLARERLHWQRCAATLGPPRARGTQPAQGTLQALRCTGAAPRRRRRPPAASPASPPPPLQMVVERASAGDMDHVQHAMDLFVDFVAIFVRLLIILMQNNGKREKREREKREKRQ